MASRRLPSPDPLPSVLDSSNHLSSTSDPEGSPLSLSNSSSAHQQEALPQLPMQRRLAIHHHSLSLDEEIEASPEKEEEFMSPRSRNEMPDEYVSNFVAFGKPLERDVASYQSSSPRPITPLSSSQASILAPGELVPQILSLQREVQEKDSLIASLQQQLDDHTASFQHERDLLTRDLSEAKEMNSEFQRQIAHLEGTNKQLGREVQRKQQQLASSAVETQDLQAQVTTLEREKAALASEVQEQHQKTSDYHLLRSKLERMAAQWKSEKIQLLRDLDEAKAASEQRSNKDREQQMKRIAEIESELKELNWRLGKKRDTSPSKGELSPRPTLPRSYSHSKLKKPQSSPKSTPDSLTWSPKGPTLATQKKLLREISELLGVSQPSDLLQAVKRLLAQSRSLKRSEEFIKQLCCLVVDVSPPHTFDRDPTLHQVWKWIKRLIDEYMLLRRNRDESVRIRCTLKDLAGLLSTEMGSEKQALQAVLKELAVLREMESELRAHLNLDITQSTRNVLSALKELRGSP